MLRPTLFLVVFQPFFSFPFPRNFSNVTDFHKARARTRSSLYFANEKLLHFRVSPQIENIPRKFISPPPKVSMHQQPPPNASSVPSYAFSVNDSSPGLDQSS